MVPWPWLITCGCILVGAVYGLEWLSAEGPERVRAARVCAGIATGWLLIRTFLW